MTREGIAKHRTVFDAWMNGAEVQEWIPFTTIYSDGDWCDNTTPCFDQDQRYRIKPAAPQYTHEQIIQTQLCNLKPPADCEHRIDGKLSHTILCGNNPLNESFKKCPYKQLAKIVLESAEVPHE